MFGIVEKQGTLQVFNAILEVQSFVLYAPDCSCLGLRCYIVGSDSLSHFYYFFMHNILNLFAQELNAWGNLKVMRVAAVTFHLTGNDLK